MSEPVDRNIVFDVLRRHKIEVSVVVGQKDAVRLVKGELIEVKILGSEVSNRMLQYLQHKFGVPIHHFYHPEDAPLLPGETIQ
jgi:hypothetical protein